MKIIEDLLISDSFKITKNNITDIIKSVFSSDNLKQNEFYQFICDIESKKEKLFINKYEIKASKSSIENSSVNNRTLYVWNANNKSLKYSFSFDVNRKTMNLVHLNIMCHFNDIGIEISVKKPVKNIKSFTIFIKMAENLESGSLRINSNLDNRIIYADNTYRKNKNDNSAELFKNILSDLNKKKPINVDTLDLLNLMEDDSVTYNFFKSFFQSGELPEWLDNLNTTCSNINKKRLENKNTNSNLSL